MANRNDIIKSYQEAFGQDPTTEELNYWLNRSIIQKATKSQLIGWHMKWLRDHPGADEDKAHRYLRDMINRSYQTVFNRGPTDDEYAYWRDEILAKGIPYRDVVYWHREWLKKHSSGVQLEVYINTPAKEVTRITSARIDMTGPKQQRVVKNFEVIDQGQRARMIYSAEGDPLGYWIGTIEAYFDKDDRFGRYNTSAKKDFKNYWSRLWEFNIHYVILNDGSSKYSID